MLHKSAVRQAPDRALSWKEHQMMKCVGWRSGATIAIAIAMVATGSAAAAQAVSLGFTEVAGSELRIGLSDGRLLAREALVGSVMGLSDEDGQPIRVRIDAVERDPDAPTGEVLLYTLTAPNAVGGWGPVCPPGPEGRNLAVLTQGEDGAVVIWCSGGVLAKCVRWGYAPWETAPDGTPLAAHHRACTNMARAAYADPDSPTTLDGMRIDLWDTVGINAPESGMPFEAAWDEEGAICVAHVRVPQNVSLEALEAAAPRLAGRTGEACTIEAAQTMDRPLIYNRSRGDGIPGD
jgi:hypothetical protein